jgi:NTP pyrophosphatase (non-canonical NTP hydrolase)
MTFDEYQEACERTANRKDVDTREKRLANFALGIAGEAGEVCDLIKKHLYHGQPLDEEKVCRELGDVLWYVATLASTLAQPLGDVAGMNLAKLRARYPEGFDCARSTVRDGDAR